MEVRSDMLATVWRIRVGVGDDVQVGQELLVLESMKMEIPVAAPVAGRVVRLAVSQGQSVDDGDLLVELA